MMTADLPTTSTFIGIVPAETRRIEYLLASEFQDNPVRYFAPVIGGPRSIRLLSSLPFRESVRYPNSMTSAFLAQQIVMFLVSEARYDPPKLPRHNKGVEFRKIILDNIPVILQQTIWVS